MGATLTPIAFCSECGNPIYETQDHYRLLSSNQYFCESCIEEARVCGAWDMLLDFPREEEDK